jgi:hypothetical protein
MKSGDIVAAAPKLFPAMLREIRPHLTPALLGLDPGQETQG